MPAGSVLRLLGLLRHVPQALNRAPMRSALAPSAVCPVPGVGV